MSLRLIYETCASKISIPVDDITMVMEDGTKVWSPDVRPMNLTFSGSTLHLSRCSDTLYGYIKSTSTDYDLSLVIVLYETKHYEAIEQERELVEQERLEQLAEAGDDYPVLPQISGAGSALKPLNFKDNSGAIELDDDDDGDDVPVDSAPYKPAPSAEPPQPADSADVMRIQLRGKEGEIEVRVKPTTAFGTLITHYAKKFELPEKIPNKGKGKTMIKGKVLKIDFDGELFAGVDTIGSIDIDDGETLDVKYVGL